MINIPEPDLRSIQSVRMIDRQTGDVVMDVPYESVSIEEPEVTCNIPERWSASAPITVSSGSLVFAEDQVDEITRALHIHSIVERWIDAVMELETVNGRSGTNYNDELSWLFETKRILEGYGFDTSRLDLDDRLMPACSLEELFEDKVTEVQR